MIATWQRLAGVLVATGFRAAPWTAVACLALVPATEGSLLTDRANLALGVRIARLAATLPTLEHFERPELLTRLEQLTQNRRTLAGAPRQLISLTGQAARAIGIVVLLATVYVPVLLVPLLALAPALSDRRAGRVQRRADDALGEDRRLLDELFGLATSADAARELRTYGVADALAARHAALAERVRRGAVRAALQSARWEALAWLVFALGVVAAIVVLVLQAAYGQVSPGQVVMAVSLLRRAQTQISRSTDAAGSFNTSLAAAGQLLWLEDHGRGLRVPDARRAAVPAHLRSGIVLDGLRFAYPGSEDQTVLGPLSLELPAGRAIALVGHNGAGKTTLIKLLCGMYQPTAGRILVDGADLSQLDLGEWRARLTAAFQDFVRFQLPLRESVGIGDLRRIGDRDMVRQALERAGSARLERELPNGLETQIGNQFTAGQELSGGQWQRIALARGLMREAPLLVVLDEPTASLDAPTEAALFARYACAARELGAAHGTITLLVSHRFSTVRTADLIVVLEGGGVVQSGTHEQLIAARGGYAELFELQARAYA